MSQCEGVNMFASGDYLLDDRQGSLCTTIERLRMHMVTLKERLQEEKALLSELKAETEFLTMRQTDNTSATDDYHSRRYQSDNISQSSLGTVCNVAYANDVVRVKQPFEEPKQKFDRVEYVHRLREIDSLCKEEMARMNSVAEQIEPLKQIASDWMLETRLKEITEAQASKISPVLEVGTAQPYTVPVIEPAGYNQPAYTGELIVIPPTKTTALAPVFAPEGKCEAKPDPSIPIQTELIDFPKSKLELKPTKEQQLKLDNLLKPIAQNNNASSNNRKVLARKGKKETKTKNSSSDVSLSSLEALKEKNITLIEVADNNVEKRKTKKPKIKPDEDWKSTGSGKTSKSAISLESIQRAFANHHKKKRRAGKGEKNETDALTYVQVARKKREHMSSDKKQNESIQNNQENLFAYLHPSAKKIVKNWVMVGKEENKIKNSSKKQERTKKCTLNLGRNKDAELSLCEDDVINKFLYDEDGYVYTPLFVSETENESSSDDTVS